MADFGRDKIDEALEEAPEIDTGEIDTGAAPDDETASDADEPSDDAPTPARRDRGDESLRQILADIRRLDDTARPPESRDDASDTEISTAVVAAVLMVVVGLAGVAYIVGPGGAVPLDTLVGAGA